MDIDLEYCSWKGFVPPDFKSPTKDEIREVFDKNINMTLKELSRLTMTSIPELKKILIS
tara:strand:+ start:351 stop:527 length:177 start_codon:yes stop_codon:yes gene_type:complete